MIDPQTQQRLREKYNPDGSTRRKHQLRMVEMLEYFDKLCQEHNIHYWLSSGNCIGVARHGGFIPWDDDIDVEMLREDYLKLEKIFAESDNYVLQTWKNDKGYSTPFAKMRDKKSLVAEEWEDNLYKYRGAYIDIFQLERAPRFCCYLYVKFRWVVLIPLSGTKNIFTQSLFHIIKRLYYLSIPVTRLLFGWLPKNKLRHTYGSGWIDNTRDTRNIFPLQRAKFENIEVSVPNNLDSYLRRIYGDYTQLPPEEKIQKPHISRVELW